MSLAAFGHTPGDGTPERYATVSDDGWLHCWGVAGSSLDAQYPRPTHLAVKWTCMRWRQGSPATVLALGADSGVVVVWDLALGQIVHELNGHTQRVNDVAFGGADSGKTLLSCGDDRKVCCWDAASGELLHSWSSGQTAVHV